MTVDNTPAEKSIASPADGDVVSGVVSIRIDASDPNLANIELKADGVVLGTSNVAPFEFDFDTTQRLDGVLAIDAIVTDLAGNQTSCAIEVTVDNIALDLDPDTLNLKSKGKTATLTATGPNLHVLAAALATHVIEVVVPGGSTVPVTLQSSTSTELAFKLDRQALIQSIRAGITAELVAPNGVLDLDVRARSTVDDGVHGLGRVQTRVVGG